MGHPTREQVSFRNTTASVLFDLIRGVAAMVVLLTHWKILYFVDFPKIPSHRVLFAVPYVMAAAGHQAVLIFFVLSGYLISSSIFRSISRGTWSWRSYLTHRFVRLWVVLVPGLVLGAFLDHIGLRLHSTTNLYRSLTLKTHNLDIARDVTSHVFLGNLFFLQTVFVPVFGSNKALWSLANEFWYYILFPLFWLSVTRNPSLRISRLTRIFYIALFAILVWILRSSLLPLFPVWLAGVALACLGPPQVSSKFRAATTIIYLTIFLAAAKIRILSPLIQDYVLAIFTLIFFWILLSAQGHATDSRFTRFSRWISRFSYTLYLVHIPFLLMLTALIAGDRLWSPTDLKHDLIALAVLLVTVGYAWTIAYLTEFHTDDIRKWVEQRVNRGQPVRMPPSYNA